MFASVLLRILFSAALGLGGWMVALAVVHTGAVDDRSLATAAIALPVGVGTYYGWVDRGHSPRTRRTGFGAAVAAAIIGAWLGHGAIGDLPALVTSLTGAVAAANLVLLASGIYVRRICAPTNRPAA